MPRMLNFKLNAVSENRKSSYSAQKSSLTMKKNNSRKIQKKLPIQKIKFVSRGKLRRQKKVIFVLETGETCKTRVYMLLGREHNGDQF